MTYGTTVNDLFDLAIAAEETAAAFYRGLVKKFAHENEIANFWQRYVLDEVEHGLWLERLRSNLSPQQLAEPADPVMLDNARRASSVSVDKFLADIHNLEEAYEVVNDLENSETNAVFEFLISNFPYNREVLMFLRTQLAEHTSRVVNDFPHRFRDPGVRRLVAAQD
ncbi:MAG TPA: hypothetical protein PLJ78_03800 [Anaerolineae bacterium]|nr:hypothetical protein [Anaerolineae bacterium]HQK13053.1 hypothetical protein [Anaerolineae bacterium]